VTDQRDPVVPGDSGGHAKKHRELRETKANLFSTVLDTMTDGVMVVDDKLRVVITNRALRETLLLAPARHGKPLRDAIAEPGLHAAFSAVLAGDGPRTVAYTHRGFQDRVLDVLVRPLPDHEYWGHRAIGVFRDVTERQEVERLLRDFIANASHELRTPVAAILGYAETLAETPPQDPETLQRFYATLYRHAGRLSTLLGQLLDLNQLEAHTWHLHAEPVDLQSVLGAVVQQHAEAAQAAGLSIQLTVSAALQASVDRAALGIVLGNLLQNAIKYTPPGGGRIEIKARAERDGKRVRIAVLDSGIGIAAVDQERVFERFYRVDQGRSRRTGGVGLGLSIVRDLVQQMGGRIELSSQVGKGSTFTLLLPRADIA
jgi:two-component system phosphate regulon sensor histidine kinase PhoR